MVTTGHDPWTTNPARARRPDPVERAVEVPVAAHPVGLRPDRDRGAGCRVEDRRHDVALHRAAPRPRRRGRLRRRRPAAAADGAEPRPRSDARPCSGPPIRCSGCSSSAGGHLDVLAAGAVLAAVAVAARSRLAAGALAGVAAVDQGAGRPGLGGAGVGGATVSTVRRRAHRRRAAVVAGIGYAVAGVGALRPAQPRLAPGVARDAVAPGRRSHRSGLRQRRIPASDRCTRHRAVRGRHASPSAG